MSLFCLPGERGAILAMLSLACFHGLMVNLQEVSDAAACLFESFFTPT
jgi:hypothetical protein